MSDTSNPSTRTIKGTILKEHFLGGIGLQRLAMIWRLSVWGKGTTLKQIGEPILIVELSKLFQLQ